MEHVLAVTPQTNEAFLREVDEELRREELANFGKRYGRLLIGVVGGGLVALAAVLGWNYYREQSAATQGEQFSTVYDLLAASKTAEAAKPLADLARSDVPVYRALAGYVQADVALREMDPQNPAKSAVALKNAAARFAAVAADPKVPQSLRDLALIRQTYAEYDTLKPDAVIARLQPLVVKGGPWLGSAGELVAVAQLQLRQTDKARATLAIVTADPDLPDSLRQRAVQLANAIDNNAVVTTEEKQTK